MTQTQTPEKIPPLILPSRMLRKAHVDQARVLIIDDDNLMRMTLASALKTSGFSHIECANNAQQGLKKLETYSADLVIVDLIMPEMDGFEFCQLARTYPALQDVPIIVLTAMQESSRRLSALTMGANDLLIKPVDYEELIIRCAIHLENRFLLKKLNGYHHTTQHDLEEARQMQFMLLPDQATLAHIREHYGMEIAHLYQPSSSLGGDLWGTRQVTENHLAVFIADFTGHGIASAMNVFRLHTLVDKLSEATLLDPGKCLEELNQQLFAMLPRGQFATLFYGIINTAQNQMAYATAGCPTPLLYHGDNTSLLETNGLPLAAIEKNHYPTSTTHFPVEASLVLYSDALIETPDQDGKFMDLQTVLQAVVTTHQEQPSAQNILSAVLQSLKDFTNNPITDDLTLAVYHRKR